MNKEKQHIVITGGTSFIGSYIIKEYLKNGNKVTAIIRPNSKNISRLPKDELLHIIQLDMNEINKLKDIIQKEQYDLFYHLAWEGIRGNDRDNKGLQQTNYDNTVEAMKVAIELGCKAFIGSGSQAEYGKCVGKIDEQSATAPDTEYGKAKLKAYHSLEELAGKNGIRLVWARIFSVYGVYDYEKTLIMTALTKMLNNEPIKLTACTQKWDYIYVEDVARIMYLLGIMHSAEGIYNIASGNSKPLKDFIIKMKEILKSESELMFGVIPYGNNGCVSFEPVVERLKEDLDWKCQVEFSEGIRKVLKSMELEG
ncbi:MAG: NAD-dependent epimerase/dehydratase family protein [Cellulosilyticum sp.]|nr:NAD-dependent epimerase/dehydratase family protein [Cellulosilyticum sp.]